MVGANTFRNPGLTAKLATTLDHLAGGRAILGIGGAWFEREHEAFGIDFGCGFGERLDRLDESVMLLRRLLDGERVADHDGQRVPDEGRARGAAPVQPRLPIMIGGCGPKKTLRTLARYGDQWNTCGDARGARAKDAILRERCAEIGRDPATIERTVTIDLVIRDSRAAALDAYKAMLAGSGGRSSTRRGPAHIGTPDEIADASGRSNELGFRHVLIDTPSPTTPRRSTGSARCIERLNA